jgi:uncharacterized membrane protein YphA (DoxX/SURF4 family)
LGPRDLFTPKTDAGLLVLRIATGFSLFFLFGLSKVKDASGYLHSGAWPFVDFNRKVGLPLPVVAAFLQTLNESLGALLVVCGFFAQWASLSLTLGFAVATACSLKLGEASWFLAVYDTIIFATLTLTGPGRYSLDS